MGEAGNGEKPLKIAIVGGGIGGLSLLLGILSHCDPQVIQPHLYEAAHEFSEVGAGVGFGPNAVQAMHAVSPKLHEAYGRIAVEAPRETVDGRTRYVFSKTFMGIDGKGGLNSLKANDAVCTVYNDNKFHNVHRAEFLEEMIKLLPGGYEGGLVSFKKRCSDVQVHDTGVTIKFADGTTENADAVIGCDGVKSRLRNILHGEQKDHEPRFTGKYAYRGIVPIEDAVAALGETNALNHGIAHGYGAHLVTYPINQGTMFNIVALQNAPKWDYGVDWVVPVTVAEVLEDFREWAQPVKKLLSLLQKPSKWGLFDLPPLKSYNMDGRICLLGDCAHASTPHLGAGAGMCIEDAAVLSRLLGEIKTPDATPLTRVFAAYDAVRRGRTQKLVTSSRSAGLLYGFEKPGIEDDMGKLRDELLTQWDWVWNKDIDAHCQEAIEIMHQPHVVKAS